MLPASNRGAGTNIGFPDVCNTPAGPATVPIPYPNIASNAQATGFSTNVNVAQMNALNMGTSIPMTSGDEAGTAHATIKGTGRWTTGNPIVKINNMPAISLTSPSTGNNSNDGVGAQVVPSVVHVFYTLATERLAPTKATSQLLLPWEIADYQSILSSDRARASMTLEGIGYLQIASFSTSAPQQIAAALRAFARRGVRSLLIDLRGNRGGALESALSCAELFLNAGAELGALRFFGGEESRFTSRHSERSELPITIAVDGGTASAAEIFAGILRANGRALILGEVTYGKGTAQRIELLEGTGELTRRSVGEYLLPSIGSFDHKGLEPDGALEDVGAFSLFVRGTEEKG